MALIEEVLLGAVFGALLQSIIIAKERAIFFKNTLQHLESTLKTIDPIIREVLKFENVPTDVCNRLIQQLEKTKVLVEMYSDIKKWKLLKKRKVKKLILHMDASLQRFMAQDFQAEQLRYLALIDEDITEMNKKMDQVIELLQGHGEASSGSKSSPEIPIENNSSNPERESEENPSNGTFYLHWKTRKGKCLQILFGRE